MEKEQIENRLIGLIETFTGNNNIYNENEKNAILHGILSESLQAITFITLIENEFDIEFDDDDINLEFFSSIDHIVDLTYNLITSRQED